MTDEKGRIYLRFLIKFFIPALVVLFAIGYAVVLIKTKPKARKSGKRSNQTYVEAITLQPVTVPALINVTGSVMAARETTLQPQVTGQVVEVCPEFIPGGMVKKGECILKINDEDYLLNVKQKQSDVANADYEYKIELGRQDIARREWDLLDTGKHATEFDRELTLRYPHLQKANAAKVAAEALLGQANLDLERTVIKAPFNALVAEKYVDLGSQVNSQSKLITLVGTDEYWVQVSVPVSYLKWIVIPEKASETGSVAKVFYDNQGNDNDVQWQGNVIRLLSDLDPYGRMARLLVSVKDPLGLQNGGDKKLLISSFVRVQIQGKMLENVYPIPRTSIRDGQYIWVMDDNDTLDIRQIDPVWRAEDRVFIRDGITANERLIVSTIPVPIEGMLLYIQEDQKQTKE